MVSIGTMTLCVCLLICLFLGFIILVIIFLNCDSTNKRKEKYFKRKEKQIIEQLEFEKDIYVKKIKINKYTYRYIYYTKISFCQQMFETLEELVNYIEKLKNRKRSVKKYDNK